MDCCYKLVVLLWKNMLLRKRRCCPTFCEICTAPGFVFSIFLLRALLLYPLLMSNSGVNHEMKEIGAEGSRRESFAIDLEIDALKDFFRQSVIAYTPNCADNTICKIVMDRIVNFLKDLGYDVSHQAFENEKKLEVAVVIQKGPQKMKVAIVFGSRNFQSMPVANTYQDSKFSYKVRILNDKNPTGKVYPYRKLELRDRDLNKNESDYDLAEQHQGLLMILQGMVDSTLLEIAYKQGDPGKTLLADRWFAQSLLGPTSERRLYLKSYRAPSSTLNFNALILPLFIYIIPFGYMFLTPIVIMEVVGEKRSGIKELMKMVGLPNWMHYLGWMANFGITVFISTLVISFFSFIPFIFGSMIPANFAIGWLCLLIYGLASITLLMFVGAFFERTAFGITIALVVWLMTMLYVGSKVFYDFENWAGTSIIFACLLPNVFWNVIVALMLDYNEFDSGFGFQALFKDLNVLPNHHGLVPATVILMGILSIFMWSALALYFESIAPHGYGVRKPFYYPFLPETWVTKKAQVEPENTAKQNSNAGDFEPDPKGLEAGVVIQGLTKDYGVARVVNNVHLNIHKDQITILLGHNGAGKTTLLSMIAGITTPTSGTALVNGYDIRTNLNAARANLGICPQENIMFENLTVYQNMSFFYRLKGVSTDTMQDEIEDLVTFLGFEDRLHVAAKKLSGGQKRKLNVGMALAGRSKVIILDEPTSGMDPEARRGIWDILLKLRTDRTVILTTHLMEEAEVLGDRIAIMSGGKLRCCGTTTFLKDRFGCGYAIHIGLKKGANPSAVLQQARSIVPDASLETQPGSNNTEILITLPSNDGKRLGNLFSTLQQGRDKFGIETFTVLYTSLDDVFIKVSQMEGQDRIKPPPKKLTSKVSNFTPVESNKDMTAGKKPSKVPKVNTKMGGNTQSKQSFGSKQSLVSKQSLGSKQETSKQSFAGAAAPGVKAGAKANTSKSSYSTEEKVSETNVPPQKENKLIRPTQASGAPLVIRRIEAILRKKLWYTIRAKFAYIIQISIAVLVVILAVLSLRDSLELVISAPEHHISLRSYVDPIILYEYHDIHAEVAASFDKFVKASGGEAKSVGKGRVIPELEDIKESDPGLFRTAYVADAVFGPNGITSNFSRVPFHAGPMTLNLMANAFLRALTKDGSSIDVSTHPLVSTSSGAHRFPDLKENVSNIGWFTGNLLAFALCLIAATLVTLPTEERLTKAKHLQLMTGISPFTYWCGAFLFDALLLVVVMILILICLFGGQSHSFFTGYNGEGASALIVILLCFILEAISFTYLVSLFAASAGRAFAFVVVAHVIGVVYVFMSDIMEEMYFVLSMVASQGSGEPSQTFAFVLEAISRCCAFTGIVRAIYLYMGISTYNVGCSALETESGGRICDVSLLANLSEEDKPSFACCFDCESRSQGCYSSVQNPGCFAPRPYFVWDYASEDCGDYNYYKYKPGIAQELFFAVLASFVYLLLTIMIDYNLFSLILQYCQSSPASDPATEALDGDVVKEKERVQQMLKKPELDDAFVVENLWKTYSTIPAVAGLSFGVHRGECFGLLGVNGAGKTTTFRIITGDLLANAGNAYVTINWNLKDNRVQYLRQVGYCPQFDGVVGSFTGKEMLVLMSQLRGSKDSRSSAMTWLKKVGLEDSANVQYSQYSGGMKRRLAAAVALIENPSVVLLDEPTAGVDPVSRRQLWNIIRTNQNAGQTVVLTSHSMDECEALCSRLGIMVNGQFQCLGGISYIKNKYGKGFIINVKLKLVSAENPPKDKKAETDQNAGNEEETGNKENAGNEENAGNNENTDDKDNSGKNENTENKGNAATVGDGGAISKEAKMLMNLEKDIQSKFSPCELQDKHLAVLRYRSTNMNLTWAQRFEIAENLKKQHSKIMESYHICDASLEEIFLMFARKQYAEEKSVGSGAGCCSGACCCDCCC